jgi:hypothetical protein
MTRKTPRNPDTGDQAQAGDQATPAPVPDTEATGDTEATEDQATPEPSAVSAEGREARTDPEPDEGGHKGDPDPGEVLPDPTDSAGGGTESPAADPDTEGTPEASDDDPAGT